MRMLTDALVSFRVLSRRVQGVAETISRPLLEERIQRVGKGAIGVNTSTPRFRHRIPTAEERDMVTSEHQLDFSVPL